MKNAVTRRITGRQLRPQRTPQAGSEELVSAALGSAEISLADIPENATLSQVEATLTLCVDGHKHLTEAAERLKPIIGRLLLMIQTRTLFKPAYATFTEYLQRAVVAKMGMSQASAFEALKIARAFPSLDTREYAAYGATRLLWASKQTNESDPNYKTILDRASRMSVEEFKAEVKSAAKQLAGAAPAVETVAILVRVPLPVRDRWQALLNSTQLSAPELFGKLLDSFSLTLQVPQPQQRTAATARH